MRHEAMELEDALLDHVSGGGTASGGEASKARANSDAKAAAAQAEAEEQAQRNAAAREVLREYYNNSAKGNWKVAPMR
jgi:hypothetical protein